MLRGKKRNEPAQTDFSSKCQVYSIYDEQSSVKKNAHQESRLDGVSSDPVLENSKVIEQPESDAIQSMENEKPNLMANEDYTTRQDMHAPMISVTSVKVQKAKSVFTKGDEQIVGRQKHLKASIVGQSEGTSLIKHVDQSLQH